VLPQLLPFAMVAPHAKEKTYVVWFNLDAPENAVEVDPDTVAGALLVQRETETGTFLRKIGPESVNRLSRNVYLVTVSQDTPVARFTFTLEKLGFLGGGTIKDWADKRGYAFVGQGSTRDVVTSYSLRADLVG
jgi:hypothetical protein